MPYEPTLLRSNEALIALRPAKWEPQVGHKIVHIKVKAVKITAEQDALRAGMFTDVMACGRKGIGDKLTGTPDANRASCRPCLQKYKPKRGQPPVRGAT